MLPKIFIKLDEKTERKTIPIDEITTNILKTNIKEIFAFRSLYEFRKIGPHAVEKAELKIRITEAILYANANSPRS